MRCTGPPSLDGGTGFPSSGDTPETSAPPTLPMREEAFAREVPRRAVRRGTGVGATLGALTLCVSWSPGRPDRHAPSSAGGPTFSSRAA